VEPGGRIVTRTWPHDNEHIASITVARDDLVLEEASTTDPQVFNQVHGPFSTYQRHVEVSSDAITETTTYRLTIPWFNWLFRIPVKQVLRRRVSHRGWWSPPDRLDATQVLVLGLLAAASMSAAFINTLFTQTAKFAADDFGVGDSGVGFAGAIVRAGIIVALPAAVLADRIGRRRVMVAVAWIAPLLSILGAAAPSFAVLVGTQTLARPMGIALSFLVGVMAAEEMPKNTRAYAISVLAMASGFGAGIAVSSLALADLGSGAWRLVYVVSAIWCIVALDLTRRLPETRRFVAAAVERTAPRVPLDRKRMVLLGSVAFIGNIFISPASFFQNSYLSDVRGYSAGLIGLFSLAVGTPAAIGLIIGGRFADTHGRKPLIAVALPLSTLAVVLAFTFGGPILWGFSFLAGITGSMAFPAMAVYRTELFPTGNRTRAAGIITALALLGGIGGLIGTGQLIDAGWSYSTVIGMFALAQVVVTIIVITSYPETAHQELEDLNPEDATLIITGA
jgi:MFS family permease